MRALEWPAPHSALPDRGGQQRADLGPRCLRAGQLEPGPARKGLLGLSARLSSACLPVLTACARSLPGGAWPSWVGRYSKQLRRRGGPRGGHPARARGCDDTPVIASGSLSLRCAAEGWGRSGPSAPCCPPAWGTPAAGGAAEVAALAGGRRGNECGREAE